MSVDIVNLIESNPITKFSGDYQSKLVEKVKNNFSNYEQQLFLSSFYCYLKYNPKNDFVIDLDNVWGWLGFGQKVNAKRVLEKNFKINIDYKLSLCQPAKQTNQTKGGQNKEIFMLNINTFKRFCLKAETKKADEVHEYFIKLENIMFEITKEESNELKLQLEQKTNELTQIEDKKNKEYEQKLAKEKILEREKILLKEFETIGSIFYIIKVKTFENGQYIVKVGESRIGIINRYKEHKYKYDECLLLDCFLVNRSKDFETFIKDNEKISPSNIKDLPGHENETELFLIGKNLSYKTLLNIVNNNVKYFNDNNQEIEKLKLELEILKLKENSPQISNLDNEMVKELIKTVNILNRKIDNLEKSNQEIMNKLNSQQTKLTTGFNQQLPSLGPRVQKINPETMQLVKVYESVTEIMNENKDIKRPSINKAVQENTIYCGFRWLLVERNLDPNIINNISPTKQTRSQNTGYIAQINKEQTDIVNVFIDRKTASQMNGFQSSSALDNPVKNFTLTKGFYYKLYDDCEIILREKFEEKNKGLPLLYKNGIGQYDSENNLVNTFACKYDCIKTLKMSDKTLAKSLEKNIKYNGFYYKELGSKLKCL